MHFSQSKYLQIKKGQKLLKLNNDFPSEFRIFSFFLFSLSCVASACYAFVRPSHAPFFLATISSKYLLRWLYTLRHFHYIIKTEYSFELNKLMRRFFYWSVRSNNRKQKTLMPDGPHSHSKSLWFIWEQTLLCRPFLGFYCHAIKNKNANHSIQKV